jgi:hypothetical protein
MNDEKGNRDQIVNDSDPCIEKHERWKSNLYPFSIRKFVSNRVRGTFGNERNCLCYGGNFRSKKLRLIQFLKTQFDRGWRSESNEHGTENLGKI